MATRKRAPARRRPSSSSKPAPAPGSSGSAAAPGSSSMPAAPDGSGTEPGPEPSPGSATNRAAVEGAGAFLALFAIPLLVNLLEGGPAQMWGWVKAKWLNQPYALGPAPTKSGKQVYPTPTGQPPPPTIFQQLTTVSSK
jgi:hypothetical protein